MNAIVIGLGGMGRFTASLLKGLIKAENPALLKNIRFIGIDVDPNLPGGTEGLDIEITISIRNVSRELTALLKNSDFTKWWIDNYIPSPPEDKIEGDTAANQIRIHGRLALYHSWGTVMENLKGSLTAFPEGEPYIFIITSLGGGTGSGIFIDIAALIKHMRDNAIIFGFFLDGTITYKIVEQGVSNRYNTFLNSYAAIVELLHFLKNPDFYDFKGIELNRNLALFDYCFLFQSVTKNDYTFVDPDTYTLKRNYANLIAYNIYPVISIQDFEKSQIGNVYPPYRHTGDQSEFNFHGSAAGRITLSKEKIIEYILSCLAQELLQIKNENFKIVSFSDTIEKNYNLNEKENTLTISLNQVSQKNASIVQIYEEVTRRLSVYQLDDKILKNLPSQISLITTIIEPQNLQNIFEEYNKEMKSKLDTRIDEVKNAIDKKIEEFIKTKSLNFDLLLNWLQEGKNRINQNKKEIEERKRKLTPSTEMIKNLPSYWQDIFRAKPRIFFVINPKRIENVQKYIKEYKNYIDTRKNEILYPLLINFYEELEKFLEIKIKCFEILKSKLEGVKKEFSDTITRITWRDIPIDEYRLQRKEYFLEMKIDLDNDIINDYILKNVREKLKNNMSMYLEGLWKGKATPHREEIPGLEYYIKEIENQIREGKELKIRGDTHIVNDIKNLIEETMKEDVRSEVNKYSIEDVLKWWLEKKFFEKVKNYVTSRDEKGLVEFRTKYGNLFGDKVNNLANSERFNQPKSVDKIKEEWIEDAIVALLIQFKSYISPFIQYTENENNNRRRTLGLNEGERVLNVIYKSQTGAEFSQRILDGLMKAGFKFQEVPLPSTSLWIISQEFEISPHVLSSYIKFNGFETQKQYINHINNVRKTIREKKSPERPYHTDKRFYNEWQITLGQVEPKQQIYWLIITSLGLGVIQRVTRGKTKAFYYSNQKLGDTLPKTVNFLIKNDMIRKDIKNKCLDELESMYVTNNRNYQKIEDIFKKSYQILTTLQAPGDDTARNMMEMVEYLPSGKRGSNNRVPNNFDELKELFEKI
jgi:hypothetical protein